MARLVDEAILLRTVDFSESDRIVHLLTPRRGRLAAVAKGARRSVRRFPGTLDLFNHLRVHVEQRRATTLPRLEQAVLLSPFLGLRARPARFAFACSVVELLDRLAPEGGPPRDMRRLFEFALRALRAIERQEPDGRLRLWLELRTLDALGLRPELRHCVRCGRPAEGPGSVAFHVAEGGVLCRACEAGLDALPRLHLGTLRTLEQGLHFDLEHLGRLGLPPAALAEAGRLVARFKRFHVGLELRSEVVLDDLLGEPASPPAP